MKLLEENRYILLSFNAMIEFSIFLEMLGFELRALCLQQVLYYLIYASSPFCFGYFGDRISLFAQVGLDCDLPILSLLQFLV
jgi:hypothetical protein